MSIKMKRRQEGQKENAAEMSAAFDGLCRLFSEDGRADDAGVVTELGDHDFRLRVSFLRVRLREHLLDERLGQVFAFVARNFDTQKRVRPELAYIFLSN